MDIFTNNALLPTDIKKDQLAKIAASKRHSVLYVQPQRPLNRLRDHATLQKEKKGKCSFHFRQTVTPNTNLYNFKTIFTCPN